MLIFGTSQRKSGVLMEPVQSGATMEDQYEIIYEFIVDGYDSAIGFDRLTHGTPPSY